MTNPYLTAGQRLRTWRESRGLSQTAAAALIPVCQPTWSDWEADRKKPHIEHGLRIEQLTRGACPIEMFAERGATSTEG